MGFSHSIRQVTPLYDKNSYINACNNNIKLFCKKISIKRFVEIKACSLVLLKIFLHKIVEIIAEQRGD